MPPYNYVRTTRRATGNSRTTLVDKNFEKALDVVKNGSTVSSVRKKIVVCELLCKTFYLFVLSYSLFSVRDR